MFIQEKELKVYAKTNSIDKVFATKNENSPKTQWKLEFKLKGEKERATLITAINKPRMFPNINYLVECLNLWCPNVANLIVDIKKK